MTKTQKRKIHIVILMVVGAICFGLFVFAKYPIINFIPFNQNIEEVIDINEGDILEQTIKVDQPIDEIQFLVATYSQTNLKGKLDITAYDSQTDELLGSYSLNLENILDNSTQNISFGKPLNPKSQELKFEIIPHYEGSGKIIALYGSNITCDKISNLKLNGFQTNKSINIKVGKKHLKETLFKSIEIVVTFMVLALLVLRLLCEIKNKGVLNRLKNKTVTKNIFKFTCYQILIIVISIITLYFWRNTNSVIDTSFYKWIYIVVSLEILALLIANYQKKIICVEKMYLFVSIMLGVIICISLPPHASWDEQIHYQEVIKMTDIDYPRISVYENSVIIGTPIFNLPEKYDRLNYMNQLSEIKEDTNANETLPVRLFQKVGYLPNVIGNFIAKTLSLPGAWIYVFGRISNIVFCSFIFYLAMKRLKSGKLILASVALFQTNLYLMSSYTYDAWLTSMLAYAVCIVISELQQPEKIMTKKEYMYLTMVFVLGLLAKPVYFPIMLIMLLLKREKFISKNDYKKTLIMLGSGVLIVCSTLLFTLLFSNTSDLRGGSNINSTEQIKFILTQPFEYVRVLFKFLVGYLSEGTLKTNISIYAYLGSALGSNLYYLLFIAVVLTDRNESDNRVLKTKNRVVFLCSIVLALAIAMTSLYISFTPIAYQTINGFQQRYLIPLIFPMVYFMGLSNIRNKFDYNKYFSAVLLALTVIVLYGIRTIMINNGI